MAETTEAQRSGREAIRVMPYSMVVGQSDLKLALELAYIAPKIGGVLLSGERGTGKSTVVRAFAQMVYGRLPVTLPINATEDRVVGGWDIGALLQGEEVRQAGLLEEAHGSILYIDEVNLLDDHIVNIILDVTSTGLLTIQREGRDELCEVRFTLVGTMNPSEGGLRPQLLDRFGLMVGVAGEPEEATRTGILQAVLDYDAALGLEEAGTGGEPLRVVREARAADQERAALLAAARALYPEVKLPREMAVRCVRLGAWVQGEGHRGDYVVAIAARAHAALQARSEVVPEDLARVAKLALQHRRSDALARGEKALWREHEEQTVSRIAQGEELTDLLAAS